jgi:hypothetical protein
MMKMTTMKIWSIYADDEEKDEDEEAEGKQLMCVG